MQKRSVLQSSASAIMITAFMAAASTASAQGAPGAGVSSAATDDTDVILVQGIRASLAGALEEKRQSNNIVEVIKAEDIGKLPDQNLAEVLENVTGVQITRTTGIGTAVQIRGTSANRVEINGVSTVSSGNDRSGISFEDIPAALIAAVEVTKVSEASTIEGSVGGTINLRTIRPLDIKRPLIALRAQGEHSDLADTISPRLSATIGNSWDTNAGEIGIVLSGSYAELDVTSFEPRVDRDGVVISAPFSTAANRADRTFASQEDFNFLRIQFLDQQIRNQEFETINFNGSFEWKPADNFRFYLDATINDQNRTQQGSRAFFSGTNADGVVDNTTNLTFETVNFGTVNGPNGPLVLGEAQAVTSGIVGVDLTGFDANLRTGTQTSSRETKSSILASGIEWSVGRVTAVAEIARSESDTILPDLSFETDFINPRSRQPAVGAGSDNATPAIFDLRNQALTFAVAPGLAESPTAADLLNPANYRLRSVGQRQDTNENGETAFRLDLNFDSDGILPFFSSIDVGYRYNSTTAENRDVLLNSNFTATSSPQFFRPSLDLLPQFVVAGPDNFDAADGRDLFIADYLQIDPRAAADNPDAVLAAINEAIAFNNRRFGVSNALVTTPTESSTAFFRIEEKTNALYAQGNYDTDVLGIPVRGNIGVRWVQTELTSVGNSIVNNVAEPASSSSKYDFFLPRWSLVAEPAADLLLRAGISRDLRRPDFNDLSISVAFGGNANAAVNAGNPDLEPETVWSFDLAGEYYFSDTGFLSVGLFHKRRTNLFGSATEIPGGGNNRDITPPCEDGGIFNPIADRNIFSQVAGQGICVPLTSQFNSAGVQTQTGIELALQYDLSAFEDTLGFASGFGVIANFTYQEEGGSISTFRTNSGQNIFQGPINAKTVNLPSLGALLNRTDATGATATLDDDIIQQQVTLPELSNYAYNLTAFYEKYGLSVRARYTWRSDFVINETARFGLIRRVDDRAQLNTSVSYAITDQISVGVDAINLLREENLQFCVNDDALLCQQDFTDRRIVGGINFKF